MTADDLERTLNFLGRRRPFRNFFIEFNSGDRLYVSHPEAVARYGELFMYRGPDRAQRIFSGTGVCQLIDRAPTDPAK